MPSKASKLTGLGTLLHYAAFYNLPQIVKYLIIERSADINSTQSFNSSDYLEATPLHIVSTTHNAADFVQYVWESPLQFCSMLMGKPIDAPEPKACAYLSNGPVGPMLERDHNLSLLKAREMDPTSAKRSPTTRTHRSTQEHPRTPPANQGAPHNTPTTPKTSQLLPGFQYVSLWLSFAQGPFYVTGPHPHQVSL